MYRTPRFFSASVREINAVGNAGALGLSNLTESGRPP